MKDFIWPMIWGFIIGILIVALIHADERSNVCQLFNPPIFKNPQYLEALYAGKYTRTGGVCWVWQNVSQQEWDKIP